MDAPLATPACLLGVLGPWGRAQPGELRLAGGMVAFTPYQADDAQAGRPGSDRTSLFSVPTSEVRARFPRLYFGLGLQLIVEGKRRRFWFVGLRSAAGERTTDGQTIVAGNSFDLKDVKPARAATREWRSALERART